MGRSEEAPSEGPEQPTSANATGRLGHSSEPSSQSSSCSSTTAATTSQRTSTPLVAMPQVPQENVQKISTIVPVGPRRVIVRNKTWSIDGEPSIPVSQPTKFTHDLTVPPVIYMVEPKSEPQDDRPNLVISSAIP